MSENMAPMVNLNIMTEDAELRKRYKEVVEKHNQKMSTGYPDAGFDIMTNKRIVMQPGESTLVGMGIKCIMNNFSVKGWSKEGDLLYHQQPLSFFIYLRSSIGAKTSLRLSNSVGIIDSGYRGEIMCALDNISKDKIEVIEPYSRIAQICSPSLKPIKVDFVDNVDLNTLRGAGGFGSTGS